MTTTPPPGSPPQRRRATVEEARALASSIRLRILRLCLDHALTNKEIAARLNSNPATTLHHVRKLVATGFLTAQEERRGTRGAREVPYKATGKSWRLDVSEHHIEGSGWAMIDAFLDEIAYVDIDAPCDPVADRPGHEMARLGLRLPAEEIDELNRRISEILREYADRPRDLEHGLPYSVFLAIYPDVTRDGVAPASPRAQRAS